MPRWPIRRRFARWLAPLRTVEWVVYAKRPFAGPEAVLAYLSRYTHRVAISNSRLLALDERGVTFRWKDYRAKGSDAPQDHDAGADEFMRRFLLHVLPSGFHRIRHYGLLANEARVEHLAAARRALLSTTTDPTTAAPTNEAVEATATTVSPVFVCRHCGAAMLIIDIVARTPDIRAPPLTGIAIVNPRTRLAPSLLRRRLATTRRAAVLTSPTARPSTSGPDLPTSDIEHAEGCHARQHPSYAATTAELRAALPAVKSP